ncbi:mediator of RNA polymerase II transcription subunit 15a-like [Bidens hawaiensis]|uniref:mediator of RNA polymerase II transcription subunit 15a-like n=1 Tax=Bidens hawaiensis TaxID=980011 RepID=UPI00404A95D1
MDTSNERPTQGAHGAVGEITMESGDWRSHPQRQLIMNKILDILKKHLPFSGYERQRELKKIAERVKEEIYTAATNQSEYSRKICFNMLATETRLQNPMSGPSISQTDNLTGGDWQEEVYHKIKAMKKLYELESSDWRAGLKAEVRQQVVNKMYVPILFFLIFYPSLLQKFCYADCQLFGVTGSPNF